MQLKTTFNSLAIMLLTGLLIGCGASPDSPESSQANVPTGPEFLADTEPAAALPVGDARQSSEDGQQVSLLGYIGGSTQPFVDGLAAFTLVDPKVKFCPPEEGCPTPWDYCCTQNEVKQNIATVKLVDENGKPVAEDARQLLGVKELSLVVAEGTVKKDSEGNLSLLANRIFIKN